MLAKNIPADMPSDAVTKQLETALAGLVTGDFRERWDATKQLVDAGADAIAYLAAFLQDEDCDWELRWFAARTLGRIHHPDALNALIEFLQQAQDPELIMIAAEGLGQFGELGVDSLVQLLEQPTHRLIGVQALASIQHSSVFVPLLAAVEDTDPLVRATALTALANFRHPEVDKLLLAALKDPSKAVRREAITYLGLRSYLLEQVNLVDLLLPGLWDIHPQINEATAIALGRLGTETAVATLARVLSSPHTPQALSMSTIRALGWIEKESALLALVAALYRLPTTLQVNIVETLARFQTPHLRRRAGDVLCDVLKTSLQLSAEDGQLISAIALALGTLQHQPAVPLLTNLQQAHDSQIQLYAEAALRHFGEES
ncbi:MAG: HEAT repeat domain-containing protein [Leptolyngbya sp. SIOISBB]|nr:HEAT repeat domain-containing protein [Leptolyngbya sp. SIOISBB]